MSDWMLVGDVRSLEGQVADILSRLTEVEQAVTALTPAPAVEPETAPAGCGDEIGRLRWENAALQATLIRVRQILSTPVEPRQLPPEAAERLRARLPAYDLVAGPISQRDAARETIQRAKAAVDAELPSRFHSEVEASILGELSRMLKFCWEHDVSIKFDLKELYDTPKPTMAQILGVIAGRLAAAALGTPKDK